MTLRKPSGKTYRESPVEAPPLLGFVPPPPLPRPLLPRPPSAQYCPFFTASQRNRHPPPPPPPPHRSLSSNLHFAIFRAFFLLMLSLPVYFCTLPKNVSVADPHHFNADPDTTFLFNPDPQSWFRTSIR
jgi:hypothetical protein